MTPNDFLTSKGYTKPNYVTQSRVIVCELLKEYAEQEYKLAFKSGYNSAILKVVIEAKVVINYMPNDEVGKMPEIASCQVDRDSILNLRMP